MTIPRGNLRGNGHDRWSASAVFVLIVTVLLLVLVTSCTPEATDGKPNIVLVTTTAATTTTIAGKETTTLRAICPSTVSVQLDSTFDVWSLPWIAMVAIDGPAAGGVYSGLMVDPDTREPTGIVVELRSIRAIRPIALDGTAPTATETGRSVIDALGADPTLMFATVGTDHAALARERGVAFVLAPWERSDVALQWQRSDDPQALAIAELTNPTLRAEKSDPIAAYLIGQEVFPSRGVDAQSGSVSLVHMLDQPQRATEPIGVRAWQMIDDFGWTPYPHSVVATSKTLAERETCVKTMVTTLQRGALAVARDPERFAANLAVIATRAGELSDPVAVAAQVRAARDLGVLGDGTNDVLGDFTRARLEQMLRATNVAAKRVGGPTVDTDDIERTSRSLITSLWDTRLGLDRPPD